MNDHTQTATSPSEAGQRDAKRSSRTRRIIILLAALWVLNLSDLAFTIMAYRLSQFNELNPLARAFLQHPHAITAFKLGSVAFATVVLLLYRHHRWVELACWGLVVVYLVLGIIWLRFWYSHDLANQLGGMIRIMPLTGLVAGTAG